MKRFLVLVNPLSHGGRSVRILPRLRTLLPEGDFVALKNIEDASRLAREAKGYEAVVACGGDGTINAVAGGVLENSDTSLKFGVIYAGTSPDFCSAHGIPTNAEQAIAVLRNGAVREIPVLTANGEPFFCSMNLGMGAAVAESANRLRPKFGDFLGTLWAVLREVVRDRRYDLKVNGEEICNGPLRLPTTSTRFGLRRMCRVSDACGLSGICIAANPAEKSESFAAKRPSRPMCQSRLNTTATLMVRCRCRSICSKTVCALWCPRMKENADARTEADRSVFPHSQHPAFWGGCGGRSI